MTAPTPFGPVPPRWRRAGYLAAAFAIAAVVVVGSAGAVLWWAVGSEDRVVVLDTLGVQIAYAANTSHDLGGPECTNCPVHVPPGATFALDVWVDWVCPAAGSREVDVTGLAVAPPFGISSAEPAFPVALIASDVVAQEPGNGSWAQGTILIALELVAPDAPGDYSLGGVLTVAANPSSAER